MVTRPVSGESGTPSASVRAEPPPRRFQPVRGDGETDSPSATYAQIVFDEAPGGPFGTEPMPRMVTARIRSLSGMNRREPRPLPMVRDTCAT